MNLYEVKMAKGSRYLWLGVIFLSIFGGCTPHGDGAYPTTLSTINTDEAMGTLTRRTTVKEVMAEGFNKAKGDTRKPKDAVEKKLGVPVRIENGKRIVTIGLVDYLNLVQKSDSVFLSHKEALASAEESIRNTLRSFRPVFGGSTSASYNFKTHSESESVDFSLSQTLPWSGRMNVSTSASRAASSSSESLSLSSMLSLSFSFHLRPGGYLQWEESLISAQRSWIYAQRNFRQNRENYLISKVEEYYDTLNMRKSLESQEKRLKDAEKALILARFERERGRNTLTGLYLAEENYLAAQQAVVDALDSYEEKRDDVKLKLGIPLEYDIELIEEPVRITILDEIDVEAAAKEALADNPKYQTQRDKYEDRKRSFMLSLYNLRIVPKLSLSYNMPLLDEKSEGLENSNSTWSASINWTYNLDQQSRKSQYRSLLQGWTIFERDFKLQQEENVKAIRRQIRSLLSAKRSLTNAERRFDTASKKKEAAEMDHDNGKIGSRELNDAINSLQESLDNLNRVRVNYKLAYLRYFQLIGKLKIDPEGEWLK